MFFVHVARLKQSSTQKSAAWGTSLPGKLVSMSLAQSCTLWDITVGVGAGLGMGFQLLRTL